MSEENIFTCTVCGLHYEEEKLAVQCEAWCMQHMSCNVTFAASSLEKKAQEGQQQDAD